MGIFSDHLDREVRLERMRPRQIDAAREARPAIYVPFGSIEWHGRQNPVGLDATKAHEFLVGLATRVGGVVYPPVFFGSGGGHGGYDHTFMVSPEPMRRLVAELLHQFENKGWRSALLISGHYPNKSEYLMGAVDRYRAEGGSMSTLALVENEVPGGVGDHAAKWETSFQLYLHPETVDMGELQGSASDDGGGPEERRNWMGEKYRDHPCYGILGVDPRAYASAAEGQQATERLIDWLARWLDTCS